MKELIEVQEEESKVWGDDKKNSNNFAPFSPVNDKKISPFSTCFSYVWHETQTLEVFSVCDIEIRVRYGTLCMETSSIRWDRRAKTNEYWRKKKTKCE